VLLRAHRRLSEAELIHMSPAAPVADGIMSSITIPRLNSNCLGARNKRKLEWREFLLLYAIRKTNRPESRIAQYGQQQELRNQSRRTPMKRNSNLLFAFAAAAVATVLVLSLAPEAQAGEGCTDATLNGSYGLVQTGKIASRGLIAGVGVITFDGKGHRDFRGTQVFEDTGVRRVTSSPGTYTVNEDCTGSSVAQGTSQDFVIMDGGREMVFIGTMDDRVVTWIAKKQDVEGCTDATIEGRYGLIQNGTIFGRGLAGAVGVIAFDGKGNESYVATQAFEDTGIVRRSLTGTYKVSEDCTGSSALGESATQDFVIVDGGREMLWIAARDDRVLTWVLTKQ